MNRRSGMVCWLAALLAVSVVSPLSATIPVYLEIPDIPGGSSVEGREDMILVLSHDHKVSRVDAETGGTLSTEHCGYMTIVKPVDKASPVLYRYLDLGQVIPEMTFHFFHIADGGHEEEYYTLVFRNARVVGITSYTLHVAQPNNALHESEEEVSFSYDSFTASFLDGSIAHTVSTCAMPSPR